MASVEINATCFRIAGSQPQVPKLARPHKETQGFQEAFWLFFDLFWEVLGKVGGMEQAQGPNSFLDVFRSLCMGPKGLHGAERNLAICFFWG